MVLLKHEQMFPEQGPFLRVQGLCFKAETFVV